jgi:ABC-type lipoprotein release transport system permease subunit
VASDEVALGTRTMRSAGVAIGRTVDVVPDEAGRQAPRPVRMRVVGTVILPPNPFQATILGEGAAFTPQGYQRLHPAGARDLPFLVRFVPGVDRDAALASLTAVLKDVPNLFVVGAERPAKVTSLAGIAAVPILLSALLTIIAVGTLVHTLVRSIGAWQRDLAVLRSIGFIRRQLRAIFCWQATALATVALLIGVPTGIAAGRWGWTAFATQLGVLPEPVVLLSTLLIAVPCTLLLANLIALLPGRAAVRTGTAAILRNE